MKRQMLELRVVTHNGLVSIEQNFGGPVDEVEYVEVHPDQIPLLIAWLNEAAAELAAGERRS